MSINQPGPAGQSPVCPKCGRPAPKGARFCGFDGTAIGGNSATGEFSRPGGGYGGKICPSCRTGYPSYAEFCPKDSAKLVFVDSNQLHSTSEYNAPPKEAKEELGAQMMPFTRLTGEIIEGKYRLEKVIGEGGMAIVYKATQINIDRPVVLKVMQWQLRGNERAIKRFEQEAKFTAKVSHPNVVSVFDVGFLPGGQPYLVMEYINGESLRDKLERQGMLSLTTAAQLMLQLCRGLQEAHKCGLIHRDLKPENILLLEDSDRPDWVKIVDFGIAHLVTGYERLTKTGNITGTIAYMAPEQLRNVPVDTRADLYALGCVLFEMLTGHIPFDGDSTEAILLKQLMEPPDPPSKLRPEIPPDSPFDQVVLRALEKDPDNRYQTATEMRLHVEHIAQHLSVRRTRP
jgi:serine/threonine-protein kinase